MGLQETVFSCSSFLQLIVSSLENHILNQGSQQTTEPLSRWHENSSAQRPLQIPLKHFGTKRLVVKFPFVEKQISSSKQLLYTNSSYLGANTVWHSCPFSKALFCGNDECLIQERLCQHWCYCQDVFYACTAVYVCVTEFCTISIHRKCLNQTMCILQSSS